MIIDCTADLHGHYPKLEGGDLLIVAGDLTASDKLKEHNRIFDWLHKQQYTKKVIVAGNHDNFLQRNPRFYSETGIEYLCNSQTNFEDLKIYGSPWTKTFKGMNTDCKAFTVDTEDELQEKFSMIPEDIDILITHSPPYGILDAVPKGIYVKHVGSMSLRNSIFRVKPKVNIFGHIHECGGKMIDLQLTKCVNASHVNERYEPVNKPVRIIL